MMSRALAEIWPAEEATCTEASWMLSTTLRRFATISLRLRPRVPISSSLCGLEVDHEVALGDRSEASAIVCRGLSQRPASAQPQREAEADQHEPRAAAPRRARRRCTARSAVWLIATSTPPFTASVRAGGRRPQLLPHRGAAARARDGGAEEQHRLAVGRERLALLERGRGRARQVAERPCRSGRGWRPSRRGSSRRPRRSARPRRPAPTAPSRNCVSSGLSSVRTPYFALKARLLAT